MSEGRGGAGAFRKYDQAGAYHYALMDRDPFYIAKIRKAVSFTRPGAVVVDVGCGDGVFVKYAREAGARVIGIDPSEGGVRLARQMSGAGALCVGSAHRLPLATASADVVMMIDVVNYLSECEEAIGEAARALKPGGTLVIMSPCDVSLEAERAAIPDSWQIHAWTVEQMRGVTQKYLRVSDVVFIEKVVPSAGFGAAFAVARALGLAGIARAAAAALRPRAASAGGDAGGPIVLNTLSLPAMFVRRHEKLEFILVARREGRAS